MIISILPKGKSVKKFYDLIGEKVLPHLKRNIRGAANIAQQTWINEVNQSSTMKDGFKRRYIDAINIEPQSNELESTVSAESKFVDFAEKGIKSFDMKPGLLKSPKSKTNKKGEPYMIVSFQYGTPTAQHLPAMPAKVYKSMQQAIADSISNRTRSIPTLKDPDLPEKYQGMVKTGKKGHESYRTFRIVTTKSKGWIHPGVIAAPVYDKTAKKLKPILKEKLQEGLTKDLQDEAEKAL